jgi:hypothetical protein
MWQIDNRTSFAAERSWVRGRDGSEIWLVALKCTFDIGRDGATAVSAEQPPVLMVPEHVGEPAKSSIRYESDLVMAKTTTDVVVVGHAYAPNGNPANQVDVEFSVGPVHKKLRVLGDRTWETFGPSRPQPFIKLPVVYERAFGGVDLRSGNPERDWDWRNPIGTGFAIHPDHLKGRAVPNVEYPGDEMSSWDDRPKPAGFGVIASHWHARAQYAGTYDDQWMKRRQPLLPDDFDDRFFQVVPADQQAPDFLVGGEQAVVKGMNPAGELRFRVPRVFPSFKTVFQRGGSEIHRQRKLHTVIIEPDHPRVSLVWHSALPCHFKINKLMQTIVTVKEDAGLHAEASEMDAAETA